MMGCGWFLYNTVWIGLGLFFVKCYYGLGWVRIGLQPTNWVTFGIDSSMSILEEKKPEIQPHVFFHLYLGNHVFFLCSIQTHVL